MLEIVKTEELYVFFVFSLINVLIISNIVSC